MRRHITAAGNGILVAESSHIDILDNYIHDVDGEAHDNMAGVHVVGSDEILVSGNFFANNYDRERVGNQNNRHMVVFGSTNVVVSGNLMWNEDPTAGAGVEYKHLGGLGPDAESPFTVTNNVIINATNASIGTSAPNSVIRDNLIIDSGYIIVADRGGPHQLSNEVIEWNTIVKHARRRRRSEPLRRHQRKSGISARRDSVQTQLGARHTRLQPC